MAPDPVSIEAGLRHDEAFACYRALVQAADSPTTPNSTSEPNPDSNLGGKLLYAGDLAGPGRSMAIAANIAGCATLAATADASTQKQAIRDGVIDFLVNSLDEALRILKNEIRKRNTVAVCVTAAPDVVEHQMVERGVLPDLLFAGSSDCPRSLPKFGEDACEVRPTEPDQRTASLSWRVEQAAPRWMAKLDAIAMEYLGTDPWARRWVRLSSRYGGRAAHAERSLDCDPKTAQLIVNRFAESVKNGEIGTLVSARVRIGGEATGFRFTPSVVA